MPRPKSNIVLATRGSALALAQTRLVQAQCCAAFPGLQFLTKVIKTTGDKLQTVPPDAPQEGAKGLFTKELEIALLNGEADIAVHSLKDLPTDLPLGLKLGAVGPRADARDVLIYRGRDFIAKQTEPSARARLQQFALGSVIATSSTRRQAQLLALHPGLKIVAIRGNVGTRLQKLANQSSLDGLVLAAAGLERLRFHSRSNGQLVSDDDGHVPEGLLVAHFSPEEMLPCVGQAAIGLETRIDDKRADHVCAVINDHKTFQCVTAERAFLRAMGGGCLSPVAAYGLIDTEQLWLRAVSFRGEKVRRGERRGSPADAEQIGVDLARELNRP